MPTLSDKDAALQKAKMNAVEMYFAERGEAETENYDRMEDEILDNLDRLVSNETILNEQDKSGRYEVTASAVLNEARLRNIIRGGSAAGTAGKSQKSNIVYIFTGREVDSTTKRGPTVTSTASANIDTATSAEMAAKTAAKGKESERIRSSEISTAEETQSKAAVKTKGSASVDTQVTTGSTTVITRDQSTYKLLPMSDYDSAITSVFSQAGFSVVDSRFVLSEKDFDSVKNDYERGDDMAIPTINSVVSTLQGKGIPYLVLATLNVDPPGRDSATGMNRVVVNTAVRVLDVSSGFPREVASVPAYQITGLGIAEIEARNKALTDSCVKAAREIVQRLNTQDVR